METKYDVTISTDGSCLGNPGPGGWAAVLRCGKLVKEIAGYDPESTNNKMEIRAVIEAVKILKHPCNITLRVDSTYLMDNIEKNFEATGWKTKTGKAVANAQLWKDLRELTVKHSFQLVKVKSHSGDPDNERCDQLAKAQIYNNFPLLKGAKK